MEKIIPTQTGIRIIPCTRSAALNYTQKLQFLYLQSRYVILVQR